MRQLFGFQLIVLESVSSRKNISVPRHVKLNKSVRTATNGLYLNSLVSPVFNRPTKISNTFMHAKDVLQLFPRETKNVPQITF